MSSDEDTSQNSRRQRSEFVCPLQVVPGVPNRRNTEDVCRRNDDAIAPSNPRPSSFGVSAFARQLVNAWRIPMGIFRRNLVVYGETCAGNFGSTLPL